MKCDNCPTYTKSEFWRTLLGYVVCFVVLYRFALISMIEFATFLILGIDRPMLRTDHSAILSLVLGVIGMSGVRAIETHIRGKIDSERERNTRMMEKG